MRHFDLIVIGSGSGNSILDERFDDWDVAIVEHGVGPNEAYGGTCLNVGCIPSKMFVHAASLARAPEDAARLGVDLKLIGTDWDAVRDRIFGRIDPIAADGERYRTDEQDHVTVYRGTGRFTGVKRMVVETASGPQEISADQVVVAAGSRPAVPHLPGLEDFGYETSDTVMRLEHLPERMTILGAGFISAELAHVFSALGVKVTIVGRSGRLLRREDGAVSELFTEIAGRRWDLRLGRRTVRVRRRGEVALLDLEGPEGPETVESEVLLVASGRVPNSDLIGATAGGLRLTGSRLIEVDSHQQTSVEGVWALGDVSSPFQLKHVANHEARIVQHNLLHPGDPKAADHRFVPHAVFSSPPIASVGLTEEAARRGGIDVVTATQEYSGIAYGWAMEDPPGFAKVLADPESGRLLGAHIIGPEAPTLIQPLIQAMHFGLDAAAMARGQYWIHPSMPELVENALLKLPLRRTR